VNRHRACLYPFSRVFPPRHEAELARDATLVVKPVFNRKTQKYQE
jgi:hypothetical protein